MSGFRTRVARLRSIGALSTVSPNAWIRYLKRRRGRQRRVSSTPISAVCGFSLAFPVDRIDDRQENRDRPASPAPPSSRN